MWVAVDGEALEVLNGSGKSDCRNGLSRPDRFEKDGHEYNINEVGHSDVATRRGIPFELASHGAIVTNHVGKHRGINDDHRWERSVGDVLGGLCEPNAASSAFLDAVQHLVHTWPFRQPLQFGGEVLLERLATAYSHTLKVACTLWVG